MKIGIMTFWGVPNYGCFLQAYATKNAVLQLYPQCEVEVIPYLNPHHYNAYYKVVNHFSLESLLRPGYYKQILSRIRASAEIRQMENIFLPCYIGLSDGNRISAGELENRCYDAVILGSDIIWDYSIDIFGHDKYLFGNGINARRVLSYAASFGTAPAEQSLPEYALAGIQRLKAISVRDEKSLEIVRRNGFKDAMVVPDPTLLWSFNDDKVFERENKYGDYIVVYGSTFSEDMIREAVAYKNSNNMKLVCLDSGGDQYEWCDINISQSELDPYTWAALINNAKIVMSCTFHGLLFGLLFHKPISFHPTEFIMHKISSLTQELEIQEPLLERKGFVEKITWDWDYNKIAPRMDALKYRGLDFLKENIV